MLPEAPSPESYDDYLAIAHISIITATKPERLSKGFLLDEHGKLQKLSGGNLVKGSIDLRTVGSLSDLSHVLVSLTPKQALVYGIPLNVSASRIMTKKAYAAAGRPAAATTRTNDTFAWPKGAGVLMLDYDPPAGARPLDRGALVHAIRMAAPELTDTEMLWWPSASSCIWKDETEMRGIRGQRLYLLVQDAADIPRAGKALVQRLWLSGQGWIAISSTGSLLERTLVDAAVWQTSRLDFAGGAYCGAGLEQRSGAPIIVEGRNKLLDSRIALRDLTADERAQLTNCLAEAKRATQPEAEMVREQWVDARVAEMLSTDDLDDPECVQAAEAVALQALETGLLTGDFRLHVEYSGQTETLTVGRLLENRERYHGCRTLDPLEPDYDDSRLVGRLFLLQARPSLYSFAHGGKTYKLHRAPARLEIVKGHMAEAATATIDLLRRDPVVFDFGGQLALVDTGRVHPLCEHSLSYHLGVVTQFWSWARRGKEMVAADCDPPQTLLRQIIAQGERRNLAPLDGVITAPTIRRDFSVLNDPGYDETTRLFFDPMAEDVPDVPEQPTVKDAQGALDTLLYPFETFPFVDAGAKGALLAALLTAAVRPVLPTSPAFAFDAPIQGSGKTLLASCIGALVEGRTPDVWPHTQGRDDEETRKRLFTALRAGSRALVWDNVTGPLNSASMAAFITAESITDRVLGKSESIRIPNRALLILTGNNMQLAGDLPRRVIICRIDPKTDQPFAREFRIDPLQWALDNRLSMLAAACTLIRGYKSDGTQKAPGRLASFETWDDLVRQTVVWADTALRPGEFGDPMDLVREAQAADPEAEALYALLEALRDAFGAREFGAKDVQTSAQAWKVPNLLEAALLDLAGDRAVKSVKSLGRVLKYREGRIVHGLYLSGRQDTNRGARMYRICST